MPKSAANDAFAWMTSSSTAMPPACPVPYAPSHSAQKERPLPGHPNRALIVDDDDDMRFLLRVLIEAANEGLAVAGEARTAGEAVEQWREHQPDVVVLDNRMPDGSGLDVAAEILAEQPDQSIIL